ncbi:MAG: alpha/beta-type small acid-soluble spore protein, partial [Lachnospiraceae bacterium]|nr:alpha/beta-type small acid-soluble spore protein [Lachnospiraceae bacterium]
MASSKSNKTTVPEAKAAMDRFKTEVASELGVNLKDGYNGDITVSYTNLT